MPTGRTTVAYAPALTPEEEAALAAEQAAAAPAPEQTTMYQPSSPPPAEPVAAPAPAQTEMYQPSSPPPAAAAPAPTMSQVVPVGSGEVPDIQGTGQTPSAMGDGAGYQAHQPAPAESYTSISPQVTDTSNPAVEPGYSAPASERRDSYTAVNQAYQPAAPWSSISPQDSGNAAKSAYPVSVSDFRDTRKTPESQMAQGTRYSPADPERENQPEFRDRFTDALGESLGLDPNKGSMYEQAMSGAQLAARDTLGSIGRDQATYFKDRLGDVLGGGGGILGFQKQALGDAIAGPGGLVESAGDLKTLATNVLGPFGESLRAAQSTFDPLGQGIAENIKDPLGGVKDRAGINLEETSAELADFFNRGAERVQGVTEGKSSPGDALLDLFNVPLPSFGQQSPDTRDIDLNSPDWSWLLTPGAVAREAGFQLGTEGKRIAEEEGAKQAQRARGAAIGARMQGGGPLDAALAAARPIAQDARLALRDGLPIDPSGLRSALNVDIPYDPLSSAYVPREPGTGTTDPSIMQRAREAATEAKNWASGLSLPEVNLPNVSLPGQGEAAPESPEFVVRRTGPEGIDPNALYMPEAPLPLDQQGAPFDPDRRGLPWEGPTLMDRIRGAGSDLAERLPDVNMPDVSMPDVNISLPGRGGTPIDAGQRWAPPAQNTTTGPGGQATDPLQQVFEEQGAAASAVRSTTQPEGTSVAQEAGANWIKDAGGNYVGIVDPSTGEYVMLPANATNEEKQKIVDGILAASTANAAPGPATAAPATTTTGATNATNTSNGTTNSGGTSTSSGNSNYSDNSGNTSTGRRSNGKSETYSSDDDEYDAPLKLEDFIQDFDGDGVINKRDRMQGKQAFEQAKMARSKKRRGKTTGRKGNSSQFPFNRQDSPIRTTVLNAIAESQAKG